jgi:hypothetical protein
LRISKRKDDDQVASEGRIAGRNWAEARARAVELERLAQVYDAIGGLGVSPSSQSSRSPGEQFFKIICDEDDFTPFGASQFWKLELDDSKARLRAADFVEGFAEGAMDVWREVKEQLR